MSGHLDHGMDTSALEITDAELPGLRALLNDMADREGTSIALERRGLTQPLLATVENPAVGEATFLIAYGRYGALAEYPRDE